MTVNQQSFEYTQIETMEPMPPWEQYGSILQAEGDGLGFVLAAT